MRKACIMYVLSAKHATETLSVFQEVAFCLHAEEYSLVVNRSKNFQAV